MWKHFVDLLLWSKDSFLHAMGTTGLGFLTPVVVSFASIIFTLAAILWSQGVAAMKEHWRQTAAVAAGVTVTVILIVYVPIFAWNVIKVVYADHMNLVSANTELAREIENAKTAISTQQQQIADLKKRPRAYSRSISEETTASDMLGAYGPLEIAPVKLQQNLNDRDGGGNFIVRGLLFPNRPVRRAQLELTCNLYADIVGVNTSTYPAIPGSGISKLTDKGHVHIEASDWSVTAPVEFVLYLKGPPAPQDFCTARVVSSE